MNTYNDPNINRPANVQRRADAGGWSATSIVIGSLAALAVVIGIFYMMNDRNKSIATTERPAVTTNAPVTTPTTTPAQPRASETTGSTTVPTPPAAPPAAPAPAR